MTGIATATATEHPATVADLQQAVARRIEQGLAIYPRGGGTALDFGGTPRLPGVTLDTRGLDRVIDYPAADMTITVEAGIALATLREVLAKEGQRLLVDAPEADRATIGGIFATNTSGPRRFGAGRPRDQVLGVSFVTADGALVKGGGRVVKNVAGYDFPRLLTGSMGTLGVIVQLTLKVRPIPEASALAWIPLTSLDSLSQTLDRLNTSATRPIALEALNRAAALSLGGPLNLPADDWVLVVGYEDNAPSVTWQVDRLTLEVGQTNLVIEKGADALPLWSALIEFPARPLGTVTFLANLRPSSVPAFLKELDPDLWAIQAHCGNGIVRGQALGDGDVETLAPLIDRLRARAVRNGGNLIVPRCPAEAKERLRVWGEPRADWLMAERIKRAFDPKGMMNPGRFVGTI